MEIKNKHLVIGLICVVLVLALFFGSFVYLNKTAQKRAYIRQTKDLELISRHQRFEIEVYEQSKRLNQIQAEKDAKIPVLELSPAEKKEKQEAIEEMNNSPE